MFTKLSPPTPSATALSGIDRRAIQLLKGINTSPLARATLFANGMTQHDVDEGFKLLHNLVGFEPVPIAPRADNPAADALRAIDAWDEPSFAKASAALERRFPAQWEFVFGDGLAPATGTASVLSVIKFLDRLDALESSPNRKATRKEDRAALNLLASRGIDDAARAEMRKLLKTAQRAPEVPLSDAHAIELAATREEDALALYRWYREWSTTAHAVIKRRDQLIALGLAKRKDRKKNAPSVPATDGGGAEGTSAPAGSTNAAPKTQSSTAAS